MGDSGAQLQEIDEALEAVRRAFYAINETSDKLRSARQWSTYDTWFGGGWIASMFKRDHADRADLGMRNVDRAMAAVRAELADVDVSGLEDVGRLGDGPVARTLDVWFDNVVTDLMTDVRLRKAQDRVNLLGRALVVLQSELQRRRAELVSEG